MQFHCFYEVSCLSKDKEVVWSEVSNNTVLNVGKEKVLDILFDGATAKITTWHIGLSTDNGSLTPTYSLIGEVGTRQPVTFTRENQTMTSSTAVFTGIAATVRKLFLANALTSGIIFSVLNLSASRTIAVDDTIQIVYNVSIIQ